MVLHVHNTRVLYFLSKPNMKKISFLSFSTSSKQTLNSTNLLFFGLFIEGIDGGSGKKIATPI